MKKTKGERLNETVTLLSHKNRASGASDSLGKLSGTLFCFHWS